jgi:PAS domain S-box-containing protein
LPKTRVRIIDIAMSPNVSKSSDQPEAKLLESGLFRGDALFDHVHDIVFFLKDTQGRYTAVNDALVRRLGFAHKSGLLGKTVEQVFPQPLAASFAKQDQRILQGGAAINGQLELHLYANRQPGWCLTWKVALTDPKGRIVGLAGLSRDIQQQMGTDNEADAVSRVIEHIGAHLDSPLHLEDLAAMAKLSVFQFDQRIRALFGISAGQYVIRARIEWACSRLQNTKEPISEVALNCGYADQASFTRQFRKSVGITPSAYREMRST